MLVKHALICLQPVQPITFGLRVMCCPFVDIIAARCFMRCLTRPKNVISYDPSLAPATSNCYFLVYEGSEIASVHPESFFDAINSCCSRVWKYWLSTWVERCD
jgi:hypothetical protein